jgi:TonB-dependent SusC/RagA subfamily outer membrane receptor
VADLLTARAPGVLVIPPTQTGAGTRVRIRGTSSLSLSNNPIYIIDGVRVEGTTGSSTVSVGGTLPSRVNDINPEEIESIDVVRGPSAATLYGTDAANGVIVITTKKGRAGRVRPTAFVELGRSSDENDYPANYTLFGKLNGGTTSRSCVLNDVANKRCTIDSVAAFTPLRDPLTTPLTNGNRQTYGVQASGGADLARYFTSVEYSSEVGPYTFPQFELNRFAATNTAIRGNQLNPSANIRQSYRANLNSAPSSKLDLALNSNYIVVDTRLPQTDNNVTGLFYNALRAPGTRDTILYGYTSYTPGDIFQQTTTQNVNRFIGSTNANWRPLSWLANRANVGVDLTDRIDQNLCRRGECPNFGTRRTEGFANDNRTNIRNITVDLGSTASYAPRSWMESKSTLGVQYVNYRIDANNAGASNLPPGTQTIGAGAVPSVGAATTTSKTLGAFVEEALSFRERLYLTAAVRTDQNSAFGTNFQRVYYPKLSASYVISDEPYFPKPSWLQQLRLRSAYGAAGQQPGANDALLFFSPSTVNIANVDQPAVIANAIGNSNLKPERATEFEGGFDSQLFGGRISLDLTYYSKYSRDALIARVVPPSVGSGSTTRLENLGAVKNAGFEALVSATPVSVRTFEWNVTVNGSTNANKLVSLGNVPPIIGTTTQNKAGYPLNGYWGRKLLSWNDADGNQLITASELTVGDTAEFMGYSLPRHTIAVTNGFNLFDRQVRVNALVDWNGGFYRYNNTERFRCQSGSPDCRGANDPTASLEEQARAIAVQQHASRTLAAYIEPADYTRFRELSVILSPRTLFGYNFASRGLSLVLSGRNLGLWTKYSGIDPETDYNSSGDTPADFFTAPPLRYYTMRVNVSF